MKEIAEEISASEWWNRRRPHYNIGLVVAGVLAFVAYAAIVSVFAEDKPNAEITAFKTMFQALGYLIAMGAANVCYFVGPVSERIIKPKDVRRYRKITYGLGFWFSVLVPFSIPALAAYGMVASA
jgi:hypothetical protein